jgi:hypothetical protein
MKANDSTSEKLIYQFPANVDIHNPKDAWDKFYSYVWQKYFLNAQNVQPHALKLRLSDEMSLHNGALHRNGNSAWYYVVFSSEKDYTWFVMRWS